MINRCLYQLFLIIVILLCINQCWSRKRRFKRGDECHEDVISMYEVSFFGDWSRKSFPKMYPRYRPHAQWSKLVGRTHDSTYKLFREGEFATPTLQKFVEEGNSRLLEMDAQGFNGTLDSFTAAPIRHGVGRSSVRVIANGKYNKISFVVKIVPSPDWFVGIDSVDLCRGGRWRRRIHMTLRPLDGGTDKGLTYTSPNWPTHPQEPVYHILPTKPRHPASPFYNPKSEKVPKIAHVLIERTGEFVRKGKRKSTKFQNATNTFIPTETPIVTLIKTTTTTPTPPKLDIRVKSTDERPHPPARWVEPYESDSFPPDHNMVTDNIEYSKEDITASWAQNDDSAAIRSYLERDSKEESDFTREEEQTTYQFLGSTEDDSRDFETTNPPPRKQMRQGKTSYIKSIGIATHDIKSQQRAPVARKGEFVEPTEPTVPDYAARAQFRDEHGQQRGMLYPHEKAAEDKEKELIENDGLIVDCLVTSWGSWGPCSKTCGFGVRMRTRKIVQQAENGGTACPRVSVEALCGSMRTCGWNHFSMFAQKSPRTTRRRRRRRHHKAANKLYRRLY